MLSPERDGTVNKLRASCESVTKRCFTRSSRSKSRARMGSEKEEYMVRFSVYPMICIVMVACAIAAADEPAKEQQQPSASDQHYVIGPQDTLNVNVWKEPEV